MASDTEGNEGGETEVMGYINETLTLTDQFSASFHQFIALGNQAVQNTQMIAKTTDQVSESMNELTAVGKQAYQQTYMLDKHITKALGHSAGATIASIRGLTMETQNTNQLLSEILRKQERVTQETQRTERASRNWGSMIKRAGAALGVVTLTKMFLGTSDAESQVLAKLDMINDGTQTTAELQEMIYASAQRSRGVYNDTANLVARIGMNAREAFDNNAEMVQFAENLNKSFVIAGATQQEMSSATLQLTQAMASGVLRGQELNAVFLSAPNVIRDIAEYLGEDIGEIRKMAEEGKLTAEVVKNALLSATDEINTEFEAMPMTLSQAFTMGRNAIRQSLRDSFAGWSDFLNSDDGQEAIGRMITLFAFLASAGVTALSAVGRGALWVSDNLDSVIPILGSIGVALLILKAQSITSGLASAAAWTVAHWPILLLAGVLASALIAAQQFGFGVQDVGQWVGESFGFVYAIGYNVFAGLWNLIASFAEFFANVWNDPLGATVRLFTSVFDVILGIVETVASAIDSLLGTDYSGAISGFRGMMAGWVDDKFGESAVQIKRMSNLDVGATAAEWGNIGGNLGSKLENMNFNLENISGGIEGLGSVSEFGGGTGDVGKVGSVGSVKNVEGDVKLSDEDLKLYRDMAERKYMNEVEVRTLVPQVYVTVPSGNGGSGPKDIANEVKKVLIEQMASHTSVAHG